MAQFCHNLTNLDVLTNLTMYTRAKVNGIIWLKKLRAACSERL